MKYECETLNDCVEKASSDGANLHGARLDGANLHGARLDVANLEGASLEGASLVRANLYRANLYGANLVQANLDVATKLETGETWGEYLTEVVPALLTAGGKTVEDCAKHWDCHSWENCPMSFAFSANSIDGVPILLRPRANQFIRFFDAKLIPCPVANKEE